MVLGESQGRIYGGGGGARARGHPFVRVPFFFRYFSSSGVSTNSELAQFCCSQPVAVVVVVVVVVVGDRGSSVS